MTLTRFCEREQIECLTSEQLNTEANIDRAMAFGADLGISLNNFQIIKPSLLECPREGFINFHNGPLPSYGGVNVCSWAIIEGEDNYGVTWHFIDDGIDTGDIIAQQHFPIAADATALSLTMACFKIGLQMFEQLVPVIAHGSIPRQIQPAESRSYFSRRDIPNGGRINFNWSSDRISRFVRGLSFQPMPNPFVYPQFIHAKVTFYVLSIATERNAVNFKMAPGTIVDVSEKGVSVACGDGLVILRELLDAKFEAISLERFVSEYGVVVGGILE